MSVVQPISQPPLVDLVIHLDATLNERARDTLMYSLRFTQGVDRAQFNANHPRLLLVSYEPLSVDSQAILHLVRSHGVDARLVAGI